MQKISLSNFLKRQPTERLWGVATMLVGAAISVIAGKVVAVILLLIGLVLLVYSFARSDSATEKSVSGSWRELAKRFDEISHREMNRPKPYAMWGSESIGAGEKWSISHDETHECADLCKIAGALLLKSSKIALSQKIGTRTDDAWKWLYYLKENGEGFKMSFSGESRSRGFRMDTQGGRIVD